MFCDGIEPSKVSVCQTPKVMETGASNCARLHAMYIPCCCETFDCLQHASKTLTFFIVWRNRKVMMQCHWDIRDHGTYRFKFLYFMIWHPTRGQESTTITLDKSYIFLPDFQRSAEKLLDLLYWITLFSSDYSLQFSADFEYISLSYPSGCVLIWTHSDSPTSTAGAG